MKSFNKFVAMSLFALSAQGVVSTVFATEAWYPFPVEVTDPPFTTNSSRTAQDYVALDKARQKWKMCVSIPHLKDAYWLAVNYGVVAESQRLGVAMDLYEAGGYGNLDQQIAQIRECVASGGQAVIIGAISADGLNDLVSELRTKNVPVIDLVNGMNSKDVSAKSLVSFHNMGFQAGRYLVEQQAQKGGGSKVAWFPGPKGAAWVEAGDAGFHEALKGSPLTIVATEFGDTGKEAQAALIEKVLDQNPDIAHIAGTAVTAETAVPILRKRKLNDQIDVISYYFGPGVHRGIERGKIIAAPSDLPAIQARIAIDQAVRLLEGLPVMRHVGPKIVVIDGTSLAHFDLTTSLAPKGYRVVFKVN